MRIDKYLWSTRYFKTRSLATTACRKGQVRVGDQPAKPSREVFPGDHISLRKDQVNLELSVIALPEGRVGAKLVNLYRKDTTPAEAMQHKEMLRQTKEYYRQKGSGRPTKKDRRDIDDYFADDE